MLPPVLVTSTLIVTPSLGLTSLGETVRLARVNSAAATLLIDRPVSPVTINKKGRGIYEQC